MNSTLTVLCLEYTAEIYIEVGAYEMLVFEKLSIHIDPWKNLSRKIGIWPLTMILKLNFKSNHQLMKSRSESSNIAVIDL